MPETLCCPSCGAQRFSWTVRMSEVGSVFEDDRGYTNLEPNGMAPEYIDRESRRVYCEECVSRHYEDDLITEEEAYNQDDLWQPWMNNYGPPEQQTLTD